jgi:hypothetical protein
MDMGGNFRKGRMGIRLEHSRGDRLRKYRLCVTHRIQRLRAEWTHSLKKKLMELSFENNGCPD